MSQSSAEDALERLKAKIESSIAETKNIIRNCTSREDHALAYELSIKVQERKDIIYTIDEMLDKLEEIKKHAHTWKWRKDDFYRCDCGAFLTIEEVEKRLNSDDNMYVGGSFTAWHIK